MKILQDFSYELFAEVCEIMPKKQLSLEMVLLEDRMSYLEDRMREGGARVTQS